MSLKNDYPRLFQFFGGYFPDADFDGITDQEVVNNYIIEFSKSEKFKLELEQLKKELITLMSNIEPYWQEVSQDANRYFRSPADTLEWLDMIKGELYK
ncbi:hypothetical protein [Paraflavitalea speifideaquila]|uniref:hypothetical protein n=1 Tax=Paraflavitalea speifideaquila TaxID=3076558 RepID=UPI0028E5F71B|nr:hypothetical protein [Paraflavitalea speifideiaquila]